MTLPPNVSEVSILSPDYLGYIFYSRSLRYVGKYPDPDLFNAIPAKIQKVAVFVNEQYNKMLDITGKFGFEVIQLHGMESPEICKSLRRQGKIVIKVFPGDQLANERLLNEYLEVTDYFLFDTPTHKHGGSGRKFDWSVLDQLKTQKPFFLSGGIAPEDADKILSLKSDHLFGVDINSRFESEPGIKDPKKLSLFFKHLRNEDQGNIPG